MMIFLSGAGVADRKWPDDTRDLATSGAPIRGLLGGGRAAF